MLVEGCTEPHALPRPDLGVGLIGCGVVGSAVARALVARGRAPLAIAVKHLAKDRPPEIPRDLLTADALAVVEREDVDVIVEVMGGVNPAGALLELALHRGKHVVTANKELLARRWSCLHAAAGDRELRYEGAVMAGVPVVEPLRRVASGDRVLRLEGILNGTTNHVLHRMEDGLEREEALEEAQALGFAELDPSADVEGRDAAAKLAILATIAFDRTIALPEVRTAGIERVDRRDLVRARSRGYALRLVAEAWPAGEEIVARVAPRWVPIDHPLIVVTGVANGLLIEAELAGRIFIHGPGAGGEATASAVLRDIAHTTERSHR